MTEVCMTESLPVFTIEPSWYEVLKEELQKPYMVSLAAFVKEERLRWGDVYPPEELVFNAFYQTPFDKVRVVVMGQDPYHGEGQAHGLSFSVPKGVPLPPSLKNIFKELEQDVGFSKPDHGCLLSWAKQGVLLLNATLTVRKATPLSHHKKGWEQFTDVVIRKIAEKEEPVVFVLWGKNAQAKCDTILQNMDTKRHCILKAAHPSPFSAHSGFFGCKHFSKTNEFLQKHGMEPIDWSL